MSNAATAPFRVIPGTRLTAVEGSGFDPDVSTLAYDEHGQVYEVNVKVSETQNVWFQPAGYTSYVYDTRVELQPISKLEDSSNGGRFGTMMMVTIAGWQRSSSWRLMLKHDHTKLEVCNLTGTQGGLPSGTAFAVSRGRGLVGFPKTASPWLNELMDAFAEGKAVKFPHGPQLGSARS